MKGDRKWKGKEEKLSPMIMKDRRRKEKRGKVRKGKRK